MPPNTENKCGSHILPYRHLVLHVTAISLRVVTAHNRRHIIFTRRVTSKLKAYVRDLSSYAVTQKAIRLRVRQEEGNSRLMKDGCITVVLVQHCVLCGGSIDLDLRLMDA